MTKLRILNKHLCEETTATRRSIVPNPFELGKQRCILEAGRIGVELPYFPYSVLPYADSYPQLAQWVDALTRKNPPHDKGFKVDPQRFRELVEPLDFSKPYDAQVVAAIWEEFRHDPGGRVTPDPDEIAAEELS